MELKAVQPRRHHPQNQRGPAAPPHTTCWLGSSSGYGHEAGPGSETSDIREMHHHVPNHGKDMHHHDAKETLI